MSFELQVLTSLEPVDYMIVSFLPGISEVHKRNSLCCLLYSNARKNWYWFIPLLHWYILVVLQELLFRGALLPIFGINWTSILGVSALFGVLHLGSGRKYSFAVWYSNLFAFGEAFLRFANYDHILTSSGGTFSLGRCYSIIISLNVQFVLFYFNYSDYSSMFHETSHDIWLFLILILRNFHHWISRFIGPHLLGLPMVMLQCCPRVLSCLWLLMPWTT